MLLTAAAALDWAGVDRAHPVDLAGMRERSLPEWNVRGTDRRELQFAVPAVAARHGGVDVDLLDEIAWWATGDVWDYAAHAAVAYPRIVADRAGVPVPEVCRALAQRRSPSP